MPHFSSYQITKSSIICHTHNPMRVLTQNTSLWFIQNGEINKKYSVSNRSGGGNTLFLIEVREDLSYTFELREAQFYWTDLLVPLILISSPTLRC